MKEKQLLITETSLQELREVFEDSVNRVLHEWKPYFDSEMKKAQQTQNSLVVEAGKLISEKELAKRTGISRQTLRKYRKDGRLKNVKSLEPRTWYTQEAVEEFLRGRN